MQLACADAAATMTTTSIVPATLLNSEQAARLTPQQQQQFVAALSGIDQAVHSAHAAELLLLIALERAMACMLVGDYHRADCAQRLVDWMPEPPRGKVATRKRLHSIRMLLATETQRVYWTNQALRNNGTAMLSFEALKMLQAFLPDIEAAVTAGRLASVHALFDELLALSP